jgi:hypothetical protein
MKLILCLIAFSSSLIAGPILWEISDEIALKASTPQDIKEIVQLYPVLLSSGVKIDQIKDVELIDRTYVFIGETVCQNEDPRLYKKFVAWSLCQKNGKCIAPVVSVNLPSQDPCVAAK